MHFWIDRDSARSPPCYPPEYAPAPLTCRLSVPLRLTCVVAVSARSGTSCWKSRPAAGRGSCSPSPRSTCSPRHSSSWWRRAGSSTATPSASSSGGTCRSSATKSEPSRRAVRMTGSGEVCGDARISVRRHSGSYQLTGTEASKGAVVVGCYLQVG